MGYVVIVVSASFGGRGEMWSCDFLCLPKPMGSHTLSVAVAGAEAKMEVGANGEKCDEYRG